MVDAKMLPASMKGVDFIGTVTGLTTTRSGAASSALEHSMATWELRRSDIQETNKVLGKGAFGEVHEGVLNGKQVAVKTITPSWEDEDLEETLEDFRNECATMSKLLHPNIVLFMGICFQQDPLQLVMVSELMPNGSLAQLLHPDKNSKKEVPSFKQRMMFAKDTILGMNHMHRSNPPILHLDLKPHNILVDEKWTAKVADFGLSRVKDPKKNKGRAGSPFYMAPEVLAGRRYDEKADVYSFGVVLWEMVSLKVPYLDKKFTRLEDIVEYVVVQENRPEMPAECPQELAALIRKCWSPVPSERPSFNDIIEGGVLDEVFVDQLIGEKNKAARKFWKRSFGGRKDLRMPDREPWTQFSKALFTFMSCRANIKIDENIQWQVLKDLLDVKAHGEMVEIERFNQVLEWFGPLRPDSTSFIDLCQTITMEPGFVGAMDPREAESPLSKKPTGSYVIRFSSSQQGFFTLTVVMSKSELKNHPIQHLGDGKLFYGEIYPNFAEMLKAKKKLFKAKIPLKETRWAQVYKSYQAPRAENDYVDLSGIH